MLNLKEKYELFFNEEEKSVINYISQKADFEKVQIFFIGGLVRDLLLDKKIQDIDILVEGDAIQFAKKLNAEITKENPDLKTIQLKFPNDLIIDFASTRCEKYDKKGHLPTAFNFGVSLETDVERRDFTVNTLAFSLNQKTFGNIIDYLNGLKDLENKKLKILHKNSFIDDPTRILRGLKFSTKLGFTADEQMKNLQEDYLKNHISEDICFERMKTEFIDIFDNHLINSSAKFVEEKLYKLFYLKNTDFIDEQPVFKVCEKYNLTSIWLIFFTLFSINETVENAEKIADLFYFTSKEKNILLDSIKLVNNRKAFKSKYEIYKFFKKSDTKSIISYFIKTKDEQAIFYLDNLKDIKTEINGKDLISLGIKPSAEIKILLEKILAEKINNSLSDKNEELKFLKTII